MMPSVAFVGSFALCFAGLAGLCLAMGRHQQQIFHKSLTPGWTAGLRSLGGSMVGLSFVCAGIGMRPSIAGVAWFGILSIAALAIVVLLPYAPRTLPMAGASAGAVGTALLLRIVQTLEG